MRFFSVLAFFMALSSPVCAQAPVSNSEVGPEVGPEAGPEVGPEVGPEYLQEYDPADFGKIVIAPRQSTGNLVFEQAFGSYQNEPVATYSENSTARVLGRPIGRLDLLSVQDRLGFCTAFLVDAKHIVTNHHCLPQEGPARVKAAQLVMGFTDQGLGEGAEKFQVLIEPIESDKALDYAVLEVFGNPSQRFGTVTLSDDAPEDGSFLWIIGHPHGLAQHISREGCAASDPAVSSEGKLVHTCDTLRGNSGSPVFDIHARAVIGLHHAGDRRTGFNYAIPMRQILEHSKVLRAALPKAEQTAAAPVIDTVCAAQWNELSKTKCADLKGFAASCALHPMANVAKELAKQMCQIEDEQRLVQEQKQELRRIRAAMRERQSQAERLKLVLDSVKDRTGDISQSITERLFSSDQMAVKMVWFDVEADIRPLERALFDQAFDAEARLRDVKFLAQDMSYYETPHFLKYHPEEMDALLKTARDHLAAIETQYDKITKPYFYANSEANKAKSLTRSLEDARAVALEWSGLRIAGAQLDFTFLKALSAELDKLLTDITVLTQDVQARDQKPRFVLGNLESAQSNVMFLQELLQSGVAATEKQLSAMERDFDLITSVTSDKDMAQMIQTVGNGAQMTRNELQRVRKHIADARADLNEVTRELDADAGALKDGYHADILLRPENFDITLLPKLLANAPYSRVQKEDMLTYAQEALAHPSTLPAVLEELRLALSPY
ncbi:MAG: trypsin-like peptidase domain-containing protein [Pelagimonas sp.]|uniref:trypsin-like serine peptidase n=1 Tax=Pelagimonas sp. TaxID=2073170 RepID=UPI003D6A7557